MGNALRRICLCNMLLVRCLYRWSIWAQYQAQHQTFSFDTYSLRVKVARSKIGYKRFTFKFANKYRLRMRTAERRDH